MKYIILLLINFFVGIKRFILRHKWLVGACTAVTTVANAVGHVLDTMAYIVVLVVSLVITAIVFSIYNKITDDIE